MALVSDWWKESKVPARGGFKLSASAKGKRCRQRKHHTKLEKAVTGKVLSKDEAAATATFEILDGPKLSKSDVELIVATLQDVYFT